MKRCVFCAKPIKNGFSTFNRVGPYHVRCGKKVR
jgi:hypothetical protein